MVATINTRWTLRKLAQARTLYEGGAPLAEIVAKCGGTEDAINMQARHHGWRRPPRPASPNTRRLAGVIENYWRKRGRQIEIVLDGNKIRSRTVNGLPA